MKQNYSAKTLTLFFLILLAFAFNSRAQLNFSVSQQQLCIYQPTNNISCGLTSTVVGTTSYSWGIAPSCGQVLNVSSSGATVNVSCAGVFTVTCHAYNSSNAIIGTATQTIVGHAPPILVATANSSMVCLGHGSTLTVSGAQNYTWTNSTFNSSTVVYPLVATMYTVTGMSPAGCLGAAVVSVMINPQPTLNITSSNNFSVCSGDTMQLQGSGATTYSWSTGQTTPWIIVTGGAPANSCYTLAGTNSFGCISIHTVCLNVLPAPSVSVSGNNTVCLGTSTTFTAFGGSGTYTWLPGAITSSTLYALNSTTTVYTVITAGSNGCKGSTTVNLHVNPNCSDVWPGDANSDGVVDNTDVLELGLAYNNTGTARSPGGNNYVAQYAANWTGTVSTGKNKNHADCNGDGTINNGDTLAIFNNYGFTHSFKPSGQGSPNPDIYLTSSQSMVSAGQWNTLNIMLGDPLTPLTNLYGVAFDIDFDASLIDLNSVYIKYTSSYLNASTQNVQFQKLNFVAGKIYAASVRTNGTNVSGNGKIGELIFKVKSTAPHNTMMHFYTNNSERISANGTTQPVSTGVLMINVDANAVGLSGHNNSYNAAVFPNPTSGFVILSSSAPGLSQYIIHDISGRVIQKAEFVSSSVVDVSALSGGSYFVKISSSEGTVTKKLIISN